MDDAKTLLEKYQPKEHKVVAAEPQVTQARYTPCGQQLVAASFDGRIRRWDATKDDYPELPALAGHDGWCTAVAFGAADHRLFSADSWGRLQAWDYQAEAPAPLWKHDAAHDGWLRDLDVSPDGALVASCGRDGRVRLWSADGGMAKGELAAYGADLFCVRFHPDGQTLFTGDDRGLIKQWKLDGALVREFNASPLYVLSRLQDVGGVRCLALDREGKTLAAGGTQPKNGGTVTGTPTLFLFDVATGKELHKLELGTTNEVNVVDAHLHPAGFIVAVTCGTPGQGKLLYVVPGEKAPFFEYKKAQNPQSVAFRPDGRQLAVVATNGGSNGNGRPLKNGEYLANHSPIHVLALPEIPMS